jgi:hypothetical protein
MMSEPYSLTPEQINKITEDSVTEFVFEQFKGFTKDMGYDYGLMWLKIFRTKLDEYIDLCESETPIDWL